ncbi:MAG: hypothetical protein FWF73_07800 [Spirochaetes bacterium]|nr:hypothetical protein [Spirochaetota bacterium]
MKKTIIIISAVALIVGSCRQKTSTIPVDYKSDTYKISLGEDYKKSSKFVDWRYNWESSRDYYSDKASFMYSGEPLINYNNGEYLPALFIDTDKNMIITFHCSILFFLEESENSIENFLNVISKDFKKLQIDTVKKSIISDGIFEISTENHIEIYRLDKKEKTGSAFDCFEYTIYYKNNSFYQKMKT